MADLKNLPTAEDLIRRLDDKKTRILDYAKGELEELAANALRDVDILRQTLGADLKLEGNELLSRAAVAEVTPIVISGGQADLFRMHLDTSRGQFSILNGASRRLEPGNYRVLVFFVKAAEPRG